jgi:DNA-binding response OmpR family regulator
MDAAPCVILVADDEADLRRLVVRRLQRAGHEVHEAADGEEAWTQALEHTPDVAVLDVRMPRLDGYALTRRIRAEATTRGMGIILLTASAQEHEEQTGHEAGADRYMHKPFVPADLLAAIDELTGPRGGGAG